MKKKNSFILVFKNCVGQRAVNKKTKKEYESNELGDRQQPDLAISIVFHPLSPLQPFSALITPSIFPYLIFT